MEERKARETMRSELSSGNRPPETKRAHYHAAALPDEGR